jgi:hypothetical protein
VTCQCGLTGSGERIVTLQRGGSGGYDITMWLGYDITMWLAEAAEGRVAGYNCD